MINEKLIKFNLVTQNIDDLAELASKNDDIEDSVSKIVYALGKFIGCSNLFWVRDSLADKQKIYLTDVNKIKNVAAVRVLADQLLGEKEVDNFMQNAANINQFLSLFTSNEFDEINNINAGLIEIEIEDSELDEFKEVIRSMRSVMNSRKIQELLSKADVDPILAQSGFIINLRLIHQEFQGKGALELLNHPNFNDLFDQYKMIQDNLQTIRSSSKEERSDIADDLRNEVIYDAVTSVINVEGERFSVDTLKDGLFKTYMYKLKKMLTPIKSDWEDSSDSQEFLSFTDFKREAEKGENKDAGKAFRLCAELLQFNPSIQNLSESINHYIQVECTILDASQKLQELLDAIGNGCTNNVRGLNEFLGGVKKLIVENPLLKLRSLQKLLVKKTDTAAAYMYLKSLKNPSREINQAKLDLKELLGASGKEKIKLFIRLGESVIRDPELSYLTLVNGNIKFSKESPTTPSETSNINTFLKAIRDSLDKINGKSYDNEELLSLEAVVSMVLVANISMPAINVDPNSQYIIDTLIEIQSIISERIAEKDLFELRQSAKYQNFCIFMKKNIENIPGYSKKFWTDLEAAEKMQLPDLVLESIGSKIADPVSPLDKSLELIHRNVGLGYEIYEYPSSKNEKKKLLLFMTGDTQWSLIQGIDHQLGLLGDPSILAAATNVISDITSNMILEGYQENFRNGEIEFITAGFGNSGSAAVVIGSKIAALNPNMQVKSISAGSTPVVRTEDAYNISRSKNFLPIRIKYESDQLVDRTQALGDFSDDLFHTFPLSVRHASKSKLIDRNCHNRKEYGNLDNFYPAMKNPICLRNIYMQVSSDINPVIDGKIPEVIRKLLSENVEKEVEPIDLTGSYILQVHAIEKANEGVLATLAIWTNWALGGKNENLDQSQIQINPLNQNDVNELQGAIQDLQVTVAQLKKPAVMGSLSQNEILSLLFVADNRLINTNQINRALGRNPEFIDLLSEMRTLLIDKLQSLPEKSRKEIYKLNKIDFKLLTNSVESSGIEYDFIHKKDVFKKIDFEKRFFEFLGCKIALQGDRRGGIDKIGSDSYVNRLYSDPVNHFDISLYTPEASDKKQKIVIFCNDEDKLGNHNILNGRFSAGDVKVITRSELLKKLMEKNLNKILSTNGLDPRDVEIVCAGFGTEGAVATALGLQLAEEYEKDGCEVQSIGFGAPPFLAEGGQEGFKDQANFIPIRFLGEGDNRYNFRAHNLDVFPEPLTEETYYTIPIQFRSVGVTEFGQHTPDLYGDVQNIRIAMQTTRLMREIACEGKELILQNVLEPDSVEKPKRVVIDTRSNLLLELSNKSDDELKHEEPGKIIHMMKYCVELTESGEITKKQEVVVKTFFENFITAIKNNDIRQKVAAEGFCKKMINFGYQPQALFAGKLSLQRLISEDLNKAMKVLENAGDLSAKEMAELVLTRDFHRGILAGDLNGNKYKGAGGGVNGAVFFKHLESGTKILFPGETASRPFLGVYKPHPETVRERKRMFDYSQWVERGKSLVGMAALLNKGDPDRRVNNEIFAYEMYHIFGFNDYIGFPTTLKFANKNDSSNRSASFCAFIPGLDAVEAHVHKVQKEKTSNLLDDPRRKYDAAELHLWQMSKLFDFLTGNLDGHEGNAFVKVEDGLLTGATNFDYDKAFTNIYQDGTVLNQYKWANLEISKKPLTSETKEALIEIFGEGEDNEKIQTFLKKARSDGAICFSENQENQLRLRIRALQKMARTENCKLSECLNFRTENDFKKVI